MSFDDRQAAAILKKAAELQGQAPGGVGDSRLSLEDLKRIAAEAGISADMVERAAASLGGQGHAGRGKVNSVRRLTVDRELGQQEYEEIVTMLRDRFGVVGSPGTLGSAREWSAQKDTTTFHLSITPRSGKSAISLSVRRDSIVVVWILASIIGLLTVAGTLGAMGSKGMLLAGFLIAIATALAIVGGTTLITRAIAGRSDRAMDEAMARIEEIANAAPSASQPTTLSERSEETPEQRELRQTS